MVIKTDSCFYTEFKIYPGHGARFIRKDGKLLAFINSKAKSLYFQKIKAQRLVWTQQWRARHKKGRVEVVHKRKTKKGGKVYRAIQGLSVDDLRKKRNQKSDARKAARDAHLREVKERKRKDKSAPAKKKAAKGSAARPTSVFNKVPKQRRAIARR